MAAPTLPDLTWNPSAVTALSSPSGQDMLDAIAALLTASTHWKVQSSAVGYVEAAPKSVDAAVTDCRILFSCDNTTGMWLDSVPTSGGTFIVMGIAPYGGAGTLSSYDDADPYGDTKFSGYSRILKNTLENLWIIECEEILAVCSEDTGTNYGQYGGIAGAWLRAFTSAATDANDRLWGMAVSGGLAQSSAYWTSATNWLSHYNGANQNHCGYFSPVSGWTAIVRLELVTVAMTGNGYLTDESGAQCGLPFHYRHSVAPYNFVGAARQMCMTEDRLSRLKLEVGGVVKRVVWGSGRTSVADALGFFNV
jgi:hypothetical protein